MTATEVLAGTVGFTASGPFGSNLVRRDYVTSGVPVIRGQNMNGRWVSGEFAFVSEDKANQLSSNLAHPGDVVFTQRGTLGQVSLVPAEPYDRYVLSQSQMKLAPDPSKADSLFLYYAFSSERQQGYIRRNAVQSGVPHTNLGFLRSTPIRLPTVDEQRAIAGVLGALDDKIELNRRMNETLAKLASAHFDRLYWDSPDRSMWDRQPLGEHLDVVRGLSYIGAGLTDDGLPLHNLNSIYEGGGYKRDGLKRYSGDFKERHLAGAGDLIVANTDLTWNYTVIASPAIIPTRFGDSGIFSHHLYRVRPRTSSPLTSRLIYLLLLKGPLRTEVAGYANGTTVNMLPMDALQKPLVHVPLPQVVTQIDGLVAPLFARAEAAEDESRTLAELRDALLPKLISGELRVRDSEAAVEQAT